MCVTSFLRSPWVICVQTGRRGLGEVQGLTHCRTAGPQGTPACHLSTGARARARGQREYKSPHREETTTLQRGASATENPRRPPNAQPDPVIAIQRDSGRGSGVDRGRSAPPTH